MDETLFVEIAWIARRYNLHESSEPRDVRGLLGTMNPVAQRSGA